MKRIHITAITLAVLCLLMCAALAGCSGDKEATANDVTEAAQAATQSAETKAAEATEAPAAATEAETTADKAESPLVGTWTYEDGGFTYTFNADGTGAYEVFGEVLNFTYTDNGDSIDVLYDDVDSPLNLPYSIDGNTLTVKDSFDEEVKYVKAD